MGLALGSASACGPTIVPEADGTGGDDLPLPPATSTSDSTAGMDDTADDGVVDLMSGDVGMPSCTGTPDCPLPVDVLVVVDNSSTMAGHQRLLTSTMVQLVHQLNDARDGSGDPLTVDAHVMVTTTDMDNPLCSPFQPPGYEPAFGSPISTPCTDRLADFDSPIGSIPEACLAACPNAVAPEGAFLALSADASNVPPVEPIDVDGDGDADPPEAQALACLGAVGVNGCGFESPLEAMRQALNPLADHNLGPEPFLRTNSVLSIILITDEIDCSVSDPSIMDDAEWWNINPDTGSPAASSALCWNAGVECDGPDGAGNYSNCTSRNEERLHGVDGYADFLNEELGAAHGRNVFMLPIIGVPPVLAHNPDPPFQPTAGGAPDLIHRDWIDAPYPVGDLSEDDLANGTTAANKRFEYGVAPGCSTPGNPESTLRQGIAPVRMLEVCESLDFQDEEGNDLARCCVESICDDDPNGSMICFAGMLWPSFGGALPGKG